jgi:hypothetical protein
VLALHDATPAGCTLATRLASDPAWFLNTVPAVDVGLRPHHARPFRGLQLPASSGFVVPGDGIKPDEAAWLSQYALELAAIRPEQVLKRLFRAMNANDPSSGSSGGDGSSSGGGVVIDGDQGDGRSGVWVVEDRDSFSADAGFMDGGADAFG